jgi:acyl-CoA thioester hydrolase
MEGSAQAMTGSDRRRGVVTPYEGRTQQPWDAAAPVPAPLCLHKTAVRPDWVDYNGHMSESCYLLVFGDSADAFFRFFGIDDHYRAAGRSLYTVETHLHYRNEVAEGEPLRLTLQLVDLDPKRLHVFHAMYHGDTGALVATAEQLLVHVDVGMRRATPLPDDIYARLQTIRTAHAALPVPDAVGHVMGIAAPTP